MRCGRARIRHLNHRSLAYLQANRLLVEYERFRHSVATQVFTDLSEEDRAALRKSKLEILKQQERYERMPADMRDREADELILNDLARSEVAPFDKWYLRRRAQQAVLPFTDAVMQAIC